LTTSPTQNIPRRRRVGPIITQRAEEKNDDLQHRDGLVGYPQGDSSREVSDLFSKALRQASFSYQKQSSSEH
jgi:hypothetical protein